MKQRISTANPGDKILVDEITAVGPGGYQKRLSPMYFTIDGRANKMLEEPDFYTIQDNINAKIDTLFEKYDYLAYIKNEPYILKGYGTKCGSTKLMLEV